jgi:hypothetical protein
MESRLERISGRNAGADAGGKKIKYQKSNIKIDEVKLLLEV